jgi:hypothetical protein
LSRLSGSAVAGDIESLVQLVYYEDLPGQSARLQTWEQVKPKIKTILGLRLAITLGSTAGYNGARAINADVDLLQANTDYAVLGMTTDTECRGDLPARPDTGNLRVSVPGEPDLGGHAWWFRLLSMHYGLPLIPIINSANKGATLIDCVNDENGGTGERHDLAGAAPVETTHEWPALPPLAGPPAPARLSAVDFVRSDR